VVETFYTRSGDGHVGYQVMGDGPIDLLGLTTGLHVWLDEDEEPHWSRFDRRLASFSRLIRFDPRGVGVSDPLPGVNPSVESWMQDALAVLDAIGSSRTALFSVGTGGLVALLLSATHPERVSAQVLLHSSARLARADDYPWGVPQSSLDKFVNAVTNPDYDGTKVDDLALLAPSLVNDTEFRAWWKRIGPRVASPAMARAMDILAGETDLREVLPRIAAPTLVLHRRDNPFMRIGHGRYLAEHIADARFIELVGQDHLCFAGDTSVLLDEIEEFLTGARATPDVERQLATILFTDIVNSTQTATELGDRRWHELLDRHDRAAEIEVTRFGGRRIKTTGDGLLATFGSPARAIQCGLAICSSTRELGIEVRVGVHTGEVERRGDDVAGIAVNIAARVESCAHPGQVWVSRTVTDLLTGSGLAFTDEGEHALKGVPGAWRLFSVEN
jgi:class 3 adenylate cyclase